MGRGPCEGNGRPPDAGLLTLPQEPATSPCLSHKNLAHVLPSCLFKMFQ